MSEFMPDDGTPSQQTGVTEFSPSSPATTQEDVALMQRVFQAAAANPLMIPSDLMAYIFDYIQTGRLQIPIGQVFGYRTVSILTGVVNSDGSVNEGLGFSVSHVAASGRYDITYSKVYVSPPIVNVTLVDSFGMTTTQNGSGESVSVFTSNTSGALTDQSFQVTVVPVQI